MVRLCRSSGPLPARRSPRELRFQRRQDRHAARLRQIVWVRLACRNAGLGVTKALVHDQGVSADHEKNAENNDVFHFSSR